MKMGDFMNYNKAFPGHQTAMPNPFVAGDGLVKYDDGTPATVDNYARDVVAFLSWAADPTLEERKRMGLLVMLLPAHHRRAARLRQAPHLEQRALTLSSRSLSHADLARRLRRCRARISLPCSRGS